MERIGATLALALLGTSACAAAPARNVAAPRGPATTAPAAAAPRLPAGVATAGGRVVVLPSVQGGLEAVVVATGDTAWTTVAASDAIGASTGAVAATRGDDGDGAGLWAIVLSATDGSVLAGPISFDLPEWVVPRAIRGAHFRADARFESAERVVFSWYALTFYAGGANPPPELLERARRSAAGSFAVDLRSGAVIDRQTAEPASIPMEIPPPVAVLLGSLDLRLAEGEPKKGNDPILRHPRQLVATDPKSGRIAWTRPLPDRLEPIPHP